MEVVPAFSDIRQAIELLLAATFATPNDGGSQSFLYGRPGAPLWERRMGAEIFHSRLGMLAAALHVRRTGPLYLRNLAMDELRGKLTAFLAENYAYVADEAWGRRFETSYAEQVSDQAKVKLAEALAHSDIYAPRNSCTLFPLVPIRVDADFEAESYFLIRATALDARYLRRPTQAQCIVSEQFPPFQNWEGTRHQPASWLGIHSPTLSRAKRMRSAVLGGMALLPHPMDRYVFSMRQMFGGHTTLNEGHWSTSLGEPHTPALCEDLVVGLDDHAWLSKLAKLLEDHSTAARKQVKALEYYYRAWPLPEVERFPVLFMALDAIFGDQTQATRAIISAADGRLGASSDPLRIRLLMELRAAVIHGGAPDVYDSNKYFKYYENYHQDPIHDLETIVAGCLKTAIFGTSLVSRVRAGA